MNPNKYKQRFSVVRVTYEPDYRGDSVWQDPDIEPTPDTHPNAFYRTVDPLYPKDIKKNPTRKPTRLSRRRIRRILSDAGLKGERLNNLSQKIKNPPVDELGKSLTFLGWSKEGLLHIAGQRLSHKIKRRVSYQFIIHDEYGYYAPKGFSEFVSSGMRTARKYGVATFTATQNIEDVRKAV